MQQGYSPATLPDIASVRQPTRGDFELKSFMDSSDLRGSWQIANTVIPYAALWWVADWSLKNAPLLLILFRFLSAGRRTPCWIPA